MDPRAWQSFPRRAGRRDGRGSEPSPGGGGGRQPQTDAAMPLCDPHQWRERFDFAGRPASGVCADLYSRRLRAVALSCLSASITFRSRSGSLLRPVCGSALGRRSSWPHSVHFGAGGGSIGDIVTSPSTLPAWRSFPGVLFGFQAAYGGMTRPIVAVSPMPIPRRARALIAPGLPHSTLRRTAAWRGLPQREAGLFTAGPGGLVLHLTQASPHSMPLGSPTVHREFVTAWHSTAVPQPMAVPASRMGRRSIALRAMALRAFTMAWHPTAVPGSAVCPRPMAVLLPTAAARISQLPTSRWAARMAAVRVGAPTAVADLTVVAARAGIMAEVAGCGLLRREVVAG